MSNKIDLLFQDAKKELQEDNSPEAINIFNQIIKLALNEQNTTALHFAYWGIGDIYLNDKQYDQAKFYFIKALELAPNEHKYHYLLGCTYTYMKEIDKAIFHLEQAVELDDSVNLYWEQLGWVVGYNRDSEKGIEYLKKSLSLNPASAHSLKDICMLYMKDQRFNEALVCLEEAEKHTPDDMQILRLKQDVEHFKKEYERLSK